MDVRIVDTDVIHQNIKDIKALKKQCETEKAKKLFKFESDQGRAHDELERACRILNETWGELIVLMDKTIQFLTQASESYDKSDQMSADEIKR